MFQITDIADFIIATRKDFNIGKFTDLSLPLQKYIFMGNFFKTKRVSYDPSQQIIVRIKTQTANTAENIGPYYQDSTGIVDSFVEGLVPWRFSKASYSFSTMEKQLNGAGPNRVVDLIQSRADDARKDLAVLCETNGWGKPTDSTDVLTPYGIGYWIVTGTSTGFTGGNPTGFSAGCAGISSSTYSAWNNYWDSYTAVSQGDLLDKWRTACYKTHFEAPITGVPTFNTGYDYGFYTTYAVQRQLVAIARGQNDDLGSELNPYDDGVVFNKTPVMAVPYLDANDSTGSVYGINWGEFKIVFQEEWYMKENPPIIRANSHTTLDVFIDMCWQIVCYNRRSQFKLSTS